MLIYRMEKTMTIVKQLCPDKDVLPPQELSAVFNSGLSARPADGHAAKKTVVIVQLCYHHPAGQQLYTH